MPSTVGTSTTAYATSYNFQRKCFYAAGRHWVFYSDGTKMVYRTSTDGITWTDPTTIGTNDRGWLFSVWFDGTYLHYARSSYFAFLDHLMYRRGIPQSDGTITWSQSEQTVLTASSAYILYENCYVSVDSEGYPFIAYSEYEYIPELEITVFKARVTKSSTNDGTWVTQSGFPFEGEENDLSSYNVSILPLTTSRMYFLYGYAGITAIGNLWDGSSWGASETPSVNVVWTICAVNQDDDVHLIYLWRVTATDWRIQYRRRTYGASPPWGTEETVQTGLGINSCPVISIDTATNNLYCFWGYSDVIYYKKRTVEGWDNAPTSWISETNLCEDTLSGFYKAFDRYMGLAWVQGVSSPFNVRYDFLIIVVPVVPVFAGDGLTWFGG